MWYNKNNMINDRKDKLKRIKSLMDLQKQNNGGMSAEQQHDLMFKAILNSAEIDKNKGKITFLGDIYNLH